MSRLVEKDLNVIFKDDKALRCLMAVGKLEYGLYLFIFKIACSCDNSHNANNYCFTAVDSSTVWHKFGTNVTGI